MLTRRELLALALLFVVSLPAVTTRLYASDEVQFYAWLRSLAFDRDADFENEYQHFHETVVRDNLFRETFLTDRRTEAGRRINFAPIGSAVLWSPFYLAGHLAAIVTGAPRDGYSQPYVTAVTFGSAVYGFAAVILSAVIARRIVGRGLVASLVVAAGTPLVFYTYIAPVFGHAPSAFAVALFLWVWLRVRTSWTVRGALLLGATGALMAMVREQDTLLALGPAIDFLRTAWLERQSNTGKDAASLRRLAGPAIAGVIAFVVAWTPQAIAYLSLNGRLGPTSYATRKMTWTSPHAAGVLFSSEYGLFAWTPLAAIAVAGLILLAAGRVTRRMPDAPWIAAVCLLMFGLQVYMSGAVESWTVSGAFGQRRFVALTPIFVLGVAAFLDLAAKSGVARAAVIGAIVLCVWWNAGLMLLWGSGQMDRTRLDVPRLFPAVYWEIPREAPGLLVRYFSDRQSFYKPR